MRCLLTAMMLLASASASAQWMKFGEDGVSVYYYDPSMIRRDGNLLRVPVLEDLKQRGPYTERSRRLVIQYNCKDEQVRFPSVLAFSEAMLSGNVLPSGDPFSAEWSELPPNTFISALYKAVCR